MKTTILLIIFFILASCSNKHNTEEVHNLFDQAQKEISEKDYEKAFMKLKEIELNYKKFNEY